MCPKINVMKRECKKLKFEVHLNRVWNSRCRRQVPVIRVPWLSVLLSSIGKRTRRGSVWSANLHESGKLGPLGFSCTYHLQRDKPGLAHEGWMVTVNWSVHGRNSSSIQGWIRDTRWYSCRLLVTKEFAFFSENFTCIWCKLKFCRSIGALKIEAFFSFVETQLVVWTSYH
jgi:hypothetical protein